MVGQMQLFIDNLVGVCFLILGIHNWCREVASQPPLPNMVVLHLEEVIIKDGNIVIILGEWGIHGIASFKPFDHAIIIFEVHTDLGQEITTQYYIVPAVTLKHKCLVFSYRTALVEFREADSL